MLKRIMACMLFLLGWAVLPSLATAMDAPPGRWWRMPRVAEALKLTDEQKSRLDKLFVDSRRHLIDLRSGVEKERFELINLFESESLDDAAVTQQFNKLQTARTKLDAERLNFFLEVRKILGLEGFQKLRFMHRQFKERKAGGREPGMGNRHRPDLDE